MIGSLFNVEVLKSLKWLTRLPSFKYISSGVNIYCAPMARANPTRTYNSMKYVKWIFAVVLAGLLSVVLTGYIVHHFMANLDAYGLDDIQFWFIVIALDAGFGLFVFLSCLFVPMQKRNAAITVAILSVLFIAMGIYHHVTEAGFLPAKYAVCYTTFLLAIAIAYFISLKLFSAKNWKT
jgi:hypothetical protein